MKDVGANTPPSRAPYAAGRMIDVLVRVVLWRQKAWAASGGPATVFCLFGTRVLGGSLPESAFTSDV